MSEDIKLKRYRLLITHRSSFNPEFIYASAGDIVQQVLPVRWKLDGWTLYENAAGAKAGCQLAMLEEVPHTTPLFTRSVAKRPPAAVEKTIVKPRAKRR